MDTILIVDDVQTDRDLLGKVVTAAGHKPVYAADGAEAITRAREVHPSLILMDVVMQGADGFKTCRSIKQDAELAKIPVVLVTSKGTDSDKFWAKKQGADDHIAKPWSPDTVMSVIRRYAR
ncbi:MAG TPA: response regulator [Polyangiaceae bacterium]|jgi:twitching motility two-component system response regulator PilH|nr:response regulator [Polyangiaceae bacterium]